MGQRLDEKRIELCKNEIMSIIRKYGGFSACIMFTKATEDGLEISGTYSIDNPYFSDDIHKNVIESWIDWLKADPMIDDDKKEE